MFKRIRDKQGIVLVTTLMLTLIAFTIIMAVLYVMIVSIQKSGTAKSYRTALEASYGANEIIAKDVIPRILQNSTDPNMIATVTGKYLASMDFKILTSQACVSTKLQQQSGTWSAVCGANSTTLKAKENTDFQFTVPGTGSTSYTVYSKIVDTVPGNSDMSGVSLLGEGVAETSQNVTPQHYPYVYRLEIQAERTTNPSENAQLSVLVGY